MRTAPLPRGTAAAVLQCLRSPHEETHDMLNRFTLMLKLVGFHRFNGHTFHEFVKLVFMDGVDTALFAQQWLQQHAFLFVYYPSIGNFRVIRDFGVVVAKLENLAWNDQFISVFIYLLKCDREGTVFGVYPDHNTPV
jgi:hypothetical protein